MQKETQEISTNRKSGEPFRQASTMQERMRERDRERGAISSPQKLRNQIDPIPKQRSKGKKKKQRTRRRRTMPCVCPALRFGNLMSGIRLTMPEGFDIAAPPPPPTITTVITAVSGKHDILIEQSDSADLLLLIRGLIGRNGARTTTQQTLGVEDCRISPSSSSLLLPPPPILLSSFACVRRNCADRGTVIYVCRSCSSWLCNSLISVRSKD